MRNLNRLSNRTIRDFGREWTIYSDDEGYFGSKELFIDFITPLVKAEEIKNSKVVEIGSGIGRFVNALLELGASHVVALEPSDAFEVMKRNIKDMKKVTCLQLTGDKLPAYGDIDYIFSIGVIHHIPDPVPVIKSVYSALRDGGKFLVWLYGKEGNCLYLTFLYPLRFLSTRLPHKILAKLAACLYHLTVLYCNLCNIFPLLPLSKYFLETWAKLSVNKKKFVIYDQINPTYAKYYSKNEAIKLMKENGFRNVKIYHRRGYSWTVIGTKL